MADAQILTSSPDPTSGSEIDVTTVTTGAGTPNRQCVSIGDPATGANRVGVGAKGTQQTNALATQDMKDAGRTTIAITLDTTSVSTTEVLQTITIAKGVGVATSTGTSYTVTTGKTLRVQAIHVSADSGTTALTAVEVRLVATTSAITTTSPRFWNVKLPASGGGAVVSGGGAVSDVAIPDGMEFAATDLIGVSAVGAGSTAVALTVSIIGFEY